MITSLEIELIGFDVIGIASGKLLFVPARQLQTQVTGDFLRDFTLHRQDIRKFANVLVAPYSMIVFGIVQRDVDDKLLADLFDASRQDDSHIQFAADFLSVL